jgi:hypothetical protein
MHRMITTYAAGLALAAGLAVAPVPVVIAQSTAPALSPAGAAMKRADLRGEALSAEVQHLAAWAVHSGDHKGLPFIIVDKVNAKAAAFDGAGTLLRATPVLLGMGIGDTWPPGVAQMDMYQTQPWQRITPAGRFIADEDRTDKGERVLWVDYDNGIALHKMPTKKTSQRRHERMVSPDPAQHRITYGCINVPAAFYDQVVSPHFRRKGGVVYILPEKSPIRAVFNLYDVGDV